MEADLTPPTDEELERWERSSKTLETSESAWGAAARINLRLIAEVRRLREERSDLEEEHHETLLMCEGYHARANALELGITTLGYHVDENGNVWGHD